MMKNRAVVVVLLAAGMMLTVTAGCGKLKNLVGIQPKLTLVHAVNCASDQEYTDEAGTKWLADQEFEGDATWGAVGGSTVDRLLENEDAEVLGTDCPEVYLTERYSVEAYRFNLAAGKYTLKLHFAETFYGLEGEGDRVFSVTVNGNEALKDFDPFKEAGGKYKPIVRTIRGVSTVDGEIKIGFVKNIQATMINGIEIYKED